MLCSHCCLNHRGHYIFHLFHAQVQKGRAIEPAKQDTGCREGVWHAVPSASRGDEPMRTRQEEHCAIPLLGSRVRDPAILLLHDLLYPCDAVLELHFIIKLAK